MHVWMHYESMNLFFISLPKILFRDVTELHVKRELNFLFATLYRKNRSFRMQPVMSRGMKNLQSVKILASQTAVMGVSSKNVNPRKQPLSVSQQFQQSLHSLMITLGQANPFFIRCIKSNSDKVFVYNFIHVFPLHLI